jgi:cytochrome c oxidase cbb3-type subunit III
MFALVSGASSQQAAVEPREERPAPDRAWIEGRQLFESRCAGCHGLDARGAERAPDIATRPAIQRRTDAEIGRIIKAGIPTQGMPGFAALDDSALTSLVRYLRFLQGRTRAARFPGVPEKGKAIFFGRARCMGCHSVGGQGGFIASDLSTFARTRSAQEIREAITQPAPDARHSAVLEITTKDGQKHAGIVRNEDNFSLQVQDLDGRFHLILRSEIATLVRRRESLMPSDYGSTLSDSEMNDLISFLMSVAHDGKNRTAKQQVPKDEEDE